MNNNIPLAPRSQIAELVDQLVLSYHPKPEQACAWYALLGARALNHVLGNVEYGFYAGTFEIFVSTDPNDPKYSLNLCFDAHNPLVLGLEFHCWIARPDAAKQTYTEVIDFSARHYKTRAEQLNLPWNRDPIPSFIWTDIAGIEALKVRRLQPIASLTQVILKEVPQDLRFQEAMRSLKRHLNQLSTNA